MDAALNRVERWVTDVEMRPAGSWSHTSDIGTPRRCRRPYRLVQSLGSVAAAVPHDQSIFQRGPMRAANVIRMSAAKCHKRVAFTCRPCNSTLRNHCLRCSKQ